MRNGQGILSSFSTFFSRKRAIKAMEIVVEEDGFRLKEDGIPGDLWRWDAQEEIVAGKDDLATTEGIWMAFLVPGDDDYWYLNEEIPGFEELTVALENRLPDFDKNWREKVVKPALAPNRMVVYQK